MLVSPLILLGSPSLICHPACWRASLSARRLAGLQHLSPSRISSPAASPASEPGAFGCPPWFLPLSYLAASHVLLMISRHCPVPAVTRSLSLVTEERILCQPERFLQNNGKPYEMKREPIGSYHGQSRTIPREGGLSPTTPTTMRLPHNGAGMAWVLGVVTVLWSPPWSVHRS